MALFSLVMSLQTGKPTFGISADDTGASYVFPDGKTAGGLNDQRIQRLVKRLGAPTDANGWLKLASYNLGYYSVAQPVILAEDETPESVLQQALS